MSEHESAEHEISPLPRQRDRRAADVLALAFRDGPISVAVVGDSPARRLQSNRHGMLGSLRGARLGDGAGTRVLAATHPETQDPQGVLLALEPGAFPLSPPSLLSQLHSGVVQGFGVAARWGQVYRALEAVHPLEPHWYLSLLGVLPSLQGRGIGRALLSHWLESVDRDRAPAYLETDRAANVAFYAAAGFRVRREIDVLGTHVWCLWRPDST